MSKRRKAPDKFYDVIDGKKVFNRSRWAKFKARNQAFDENGKFVGKNYEGKKYKYKDGELVEKRKSQAKYFGKRLGYIAAPEQPIEFPDAKDHELLTGNSNESELIQATSDWLKGIQRPINIESGEIVQDGKTTGKHVSFKEKYEYSYAVEKRFGLTNEQQVKIYNIFNAANKVITQEQLYTAGKVGVLFNIDLETKKNVDTLIRQLTKAMEILGMKDGIDLYSSEGYKNPKERALEYLNETGGDYKKAFIENFENFVQGEDEKLLDEMKELLQKTPNEDFLRILRQNNVDYLGFALDSLVDAYGLERILNEIKFINARLRENLNKKGIK